MKLPAVGSVHANAAVDYICDMPAVYCVGDLILAVGYVVDSASC